MFPFDSDKLNAEIKRLEALTVQPGFWDEVETAQKVIAEMNVLKGEKEEYEGLEEALTEIEAMLDMMEEENSFDFLEEVVHDLEKTSKRLNAFKISQLLSGEYDGNNAILSIHAGAGGLEATDWAQMLMRMYTRWLDAHNYKYQIIDLNDEEGGGIKSCTIMVKGHNAFGYLKSEKGVHRLVRISPFDSSKRRHTSFASVDVYPELDEDIHIEIDPKDLRVDTYRSTGAGGQHVNTTDSAIRITHIPTGIVVSCQAERSQIQNRETAMSMLVAKLTAIREEENKEKIDDIQGQYSQISWGQQIRSYVFHPYSMVKDHRTNEEVGNVQKVMDGDIDNFINAYLAGAGNKKS